MLKKDLKLLLSENNIQQVIDVLLSLTEVVNDNEALFNEVILISARYRFYLPAKSAGTLNFEEVALLQKDRKSTRLNSSHLDLSRMPSSA